MSPYRVTFIGSGNVAWHLAQAFHQVGDEVVQVWSRQLSHAEALAQQFDARATDQWENLHQDTDVVVIAIHDDAIYSLPQSLHFNHALVLHTSGSVPLETIATVSPHRGVLWSPQSFVKGSPIDYPTLPLCIEGNNAESEELLLQWAGRVSSHLYRLDGNQRRWAHLCAVMVNNFGNALNATAEQLMQRQQIPFELLQPILLLTYQKTLQGNLWQQQTGPAARGDKQTLENHRQLLQEVPGLLELYNLMTRLIEDGTH